MDTKGEKGKARIHTSGYRIDKLESGGWEITYFGQFQTREQSQTMIVRSTNDLIDLRNRLIQTIYDHLMSK